MKHLLSMKLRLWCCRRGWHAASWAQRVDEARWIGGCDICGKTGPLDAQGGFADE